MRHAPRNTSASVAPVPGERGLASRSAASAHGATQAVGSLRRISELHTQLGQEYAALAGHVEIQLAAPARSSLMDAMPEAVIGAAPQAAPGRAVGLVSVRDVAVRLGVSPSTIRRWRREGKLPAAIELGGVIRWHQTDIDRWIADLTEVEG